METTTSVLGSNQYSSPWKMAKATETEACFYCLKDIPMSECRQHEETCEIEQSKENNEKINESSTEIIDSNIDDIDDTKVEMKNVIAENVNDSNVELMNESTKEKLNDSNLNLSDSKVNLNESRVNLNDSKAETINDSFSYTPKPMKKFKIYHKHHKYFIYQDGECVFCEKSFPEPVNHLETIHIDEVKQIFRSSVPIQRSNVKVDFEPKRRTGQFPGAKQESQQFYCKHCQKPIYARMNLAKHEPICGVIGKYKDGDRCSLCKVKIVANSRNHFTTKHLDIFNEDEKDILLQKTSGECKHCKEIFKCGLKSHEESCAEYSKIIKGFNCLICDKKFKVRGQALTHAKIVHKNLIQNTKNEYSNSNSISDKVTSNIDQFQSPLNKSQVKKSPNLTPKVNIKRNTSTPKVDNKKDTSTPKVDIKREKVQYNYKCELCKSAFKSKEDKIDHEIFCAYVGKYNFAYRCLICEISYESRNNIQIHLKYTHDDIKNECIEDFPMDENMSDLEQTVETLKTETKVHETIEPMEVEY